MCMEMLQYDKHEVLFYPGPAYYLQAPYVQAYGRKRQGRFCKPPTDELMVAKDKEH